MIRENEEWAVCPFAGKPFIAQGSRLLLRPCGLLIVVPGTNWTSVGPDDCRVCSAPFRLMWAPVAVAELEAAE